MGWLYAMSDVHNRFMTNENEAHLEERLDNYNKGPC